MLQNRIEYGKVLCQLNKNPTEEHKTEKGYKNPIPSGQLKLKAPKQYTQPNKCHT